MSEINTKLGIIWQTLHPNLKCVNNDLSLDFMYLMTYLTLGYGGDHTTRKREAVLNLILYTYNHTKCFSTLHSLSLLSTPFLPMFSLSLFLTHSLLLSLSLSLSLSLPLPLSSKPFLSMFLGLYKDVLSFVEPSIFIEQLSIVNLCLIDHPTSSAHGYWN